MKKFLFIIPLVLLLSSFYIIPAFAYTEIYYLDSSNEHWGYYIFDEQPDIVTIDYNDYRGFWYAQGYICAGAGAFETLDEALSSSENQLENSSEFTPYYYTATFNALQENIYINGSYNSSKIFPEPSVDGTDWWQLIKDWWFYDYGLSDLIDWLFGDDEVDNFPSTDIITASPSPSPTPTPAVRVVTISTPGPNNTTITNTYYEYIDPSTNQPTSSPDRPPWYHGDGCNCNDCGGGNNGGGGDKEPEDYEPVALNFGVPSATPYVLESENPLLYDYGDNITEYKDGIETVSQLTTVFPEKWYVIIGIIITFPIIAGFITKLLK